MSETFSDVRRVGLVRSFKNFAAHERAPVPVVFLVALRWLVPLLGLVRIVGTGGP